MTNSNKTSKSCIRIIIAVIGLIGAIIVCGGTPLASRIVDIYWPAPTQVNVNPPATLVIPVTQVIQVTENSPVVPSTLTLEVPQQVESYDLLIPSYQESGVRFDAPRNGTYTISFIGGAYSPYANENGNDNKWRTILQIYKNRDIEWGKRLTFTEPINSDFHLGDFETGNPTEAEAEARAKGTYINLTLNKGDYLIIVAVDQKGAYLFEGRNRGNLYLQIILPLENSTNTPNIIVEQTQTPSDCLPTEYVTPVTGVHPPIDTVICVPSGFMTWISSDPAQFSISSINYNMTFSTGYTFFLFGPVKFTVSSVQENNIWMDTRPNTSLFGNLDEKLLNLVYQDGKVCDYALYAGVSCP